MLDPDWLINEHIDFEYKKYRLLAYLQRVDRSLTEYRAFPAFPDLLLHHATLTDVRQRKQSLWNSFRQRLKGINDQKSRLVYESEFEQSSTMGELDAIIEFALPQFSHYLDCANELVELAQDQINVYPIGIMPLQLNEGYLIVPSTAKKVHVYEYAVGAVKHPRTEFTHVETAYIAEFSTPSSTGFVNIKRELVKQRPTRPNPATYAVDCGLDLPLEETLIPVATEMLAQQIRAVA